MRSPSSWETGSAILESDEIVFEHLSENRSGAALKGAFWSALDTLIPTALNSLVFIVTSRYLLPQDFGLVALAFSIVSFAAGLGPTAFGEALIQQKTIRQSHLDTVFWLSFASAAILYLVLFGGSSYIAHALGHDEIVGLLMIIGLKIFFDMMIIVPNALIGRTMSFHLAAVRTAIATVVSGLVCLALIFAGFGLWALAIAQIAAPAAGCIAAFWGAGWLPGLRIKWSSLRELLHYGIFASGNRFLQSMSLDQLIIGTLVSPAALGIYNFARRLFEMINNVVAGGLTSVTHVLLSSLQHDQNKVREAFLMATFGCSLVSFPAFMGLAAVADDAIPLIFGQHWAAAIWPVRFFCVIGLMSGIGVVQASLITSQGKSDWWFYYQLVRNIVTIITVLLLYPYGVTTIVFALMLEVLILWPVTLWMVSQLIALSIGNYFAQFLRPIAAYVGMLAAVLGASALLQDWHPASRLAIEIPIGAIVYTGLIFILCRERALFLVKTMLRRRQR
ncbi:lipopolysaccharide biosynthesis protein [Rhizobium paranaense]|uniref:O-antigen/teichoic acid export membrane protein n=1 Tax=Rhizobium paranaense TaxID=1650438 RepID=A0A7W8XUJ7_9HYPH|nr:lipopolysaccharide biosynthesis protein [Rhizobium paranaense]MBB5575879.1 O-antigen/teichoic acid export membrane protein [Rhizobium paranaense]